MSRHRNPEFVEIFSEADIRARRVHLYFTRMASGERLLARGEFTWSAAEFGSEYSLPTVSLSYEEAEAMVQGLPPSFLPRKEDTSALLQQYQHRITQLELHIGDLRRLLHHHLGIQV